MTPSAAPPPDLDAFLDRLRGEGYGVGVRERLLAHALLARYAESGDLPADAADRLRLLEPLLSRSEQEQGRFEEIVSAYLARPGRARGRLRPFGPACAGGRSAGRAPRRVALLAVALVALAALVWWVRRDPKPEPGPVPEPAATERPPVAQPPAVQADTALPVSPIYVPAGTFPEPAEVAPAPPPSRLAPLRWGLGGLGAVLALALLAWLVRRRRRVAYLQGVRTDEELEEHVLRDPDPAGLPVPDATVRPASRMLRQRIAGSREVLDLRATLHATMRAGGALSARYRALRHTPEYLVLVDRVSARDHQAAFHEVLVGALSRYGVAVDLFCYEGSPAGGCWRPPPAHDGEGAGGRAMASVAQLSNRYGGHRLLVFGDAACAFEPVSGRPAAWTRHTTPFPGRAWFSPLSPASWGPAEAGVDGLGFLMLPAQPESLEALAEWLASDRATLRAEADWPGVYPPSLRGSPAAWVARQTPPPAEAQEDLLYELREYLGPTRFQWLCACAVFPALSWPLTLALGREVLGGGGAPADPGALARGVAALGALPWFRYGRMPAWLRELLLDRVEPEQEQRLRAVVERRLGAAMAGGPGATLAEVAVRRRLLAWFRRRRGMARDVVLAGFLEKGLPRRLAQRMPGPLQRLLFRDGKALYGLRPGVPAAAALAAALSLVAVLPGVWEAWAGRPAAPDEPALDAYGVLGVHAGPVTSVAFSPDGQRVLTTANDGTARVWRADGTGDPVMLRITGTGTNAAAFSPDGRWIVTASPDEAVQVWRADGSGTPRVLREHTLRTWSATLAAFSPDGARVLAAFQDNTVEVWPADGSGGPVVLPHRGRVTSAAFSPDGQRVATASFDSTVRVWRADGSGAPVVLPHPRSAWTAAFSPDGRRIMTVAADNVVRVWRADGSGTPVAIPHPGPVSTAVFSPDGQRIATTAGGDGTVRVWRVDGSGTTLLLRGHAEAAYVGAFSPDGRSLVTTSTDGTARVWRAETFGASIVLRGHTSPVAASAFSPDGERVAVGFVDGITRLWGRRPGIPVNITGCSASPALYATARDVADRLAQDTLLAPVVYALPAWDSARLGGVPGPGEVSYSAAIAPSRAAADSLAERLNSLGAGGGSHRWRAAETVPFRAGALSVGLCPSGTGAPAAVAADSTARVNVYFRAASDSGVARQVARALRARGYRVGEIAHRREATGTGAVDVRYFQRLDLPRAQAVAGVVRQAVEAAGVAGFRPRVGSYARRGGTVRPNEIEVWLPELAPPRTAVRIQVHSRETDRAAVMDALRGLGFPLSTGAPNAEVPAGTRTNAVWFGRVASLDEVKRVALALIRSGVEIRLIAPFSPPRTAGDNMIQVGSLREGERYGKETLRARPYSVEEVQAATRFPIR